MPKDNTPTQPEPVLPAAETRALLADAAWLSQELALQVIQSCGAYMRIASRDNDITLLESLLAGQLMYAECLGDLLNNHDAADEEFCKRTAALWDQLHEWRGQYEARFRRPSTGG